MDSLVDHHQLGSLPSVHEVVKTFELMPKKSLGQNFLFDLSLTRKIARCLPNVKPKDRVLEIGPGPGSLTRALLYENKIPLSVIEKDQRCLEALKILKPCYPDLDLIEGDALKLEVSTLKKEGMLHIAGNLPYNIATELLIRWCDDSNLIASMVLMFQREVADRITAIPNTKAYGRLSVLTQAHFECVKIFDIGPQAFYPPPKVTSSVVKFLPHKFAIHSKQSKMLQKLTKMAFSQRRKMLRSTLKPLTLGGLSLPDLLVTVGAKETDRAESLSPDAYVTLTKTLINQGIEI